MQSADRKMSARFVACGDSAEVLETAEHALDEVSATIGVAVVGVWVIARGIARDDRLGSTLGQPVAQTCCIIGAVGQQLVAGTTDGEQRRGAGEVMSIAGRQGEGDGAAAIVAQRMDFRRSPAARGANGMMTSPPFAPAAERCALMWVESTEPVNTLVDPVRP